MRVYIYRYIGICMYVYIHVCIYIYIHTYMNLPPLFFSSTLFFPSPLLSLLFLFPLLSLSSSLSSFFSLSLVPVPLLPLLPSSLLPLLPVRGAKRANPAMPGSHGMRDHPSDCCVPRASDRAICRRGTDISFLAFFVCFLNFSVHFLYFASACLVFVLADKKNRTILLKKLIVLPNIQILGIGYTGT